MKECIFWNNEDNKFINWEEASFTKDKGDDFIIVMKEIDPIFSEGRLYDSFDYIRLNDINNNKIYADCSIVEFILKDEVKFVDFTGRKPTIWNEIKMIGYFTFNVEDLRYKINIIDWDKNKTKAQFSCLYYNLTNMYNFKIIDTIQENKLGLIK